MSRSTARIYNFISLLFLLLTIGMIALVIFMFTSVDPEARQPQIAFATRIVIPTETPTETFTPTLTLTATATPTNTLSPTPSETAIPSSTSTPTETLTPTPTSTWTVTPSPTITFTPSITPTPTNTPLPSPTPTPTGPSPTPTATDSPYMFMQDGETEFRPNVGNVAGCAWQSIAGTVIGMDGLPTAQRYVVRVFNNNVNYAVQTGTNSFYDPVAGWEIQVSNIINADTYFVRLESLGGLVISADMQVSFPQDCNANVAFMTFRQLRG
jgi:hypothetical protein